eukprot:TRINITY_DN11219_c0_g2_i1.p1 TRINITY_DN11219_c0_g2~~TRINITY_DN11219_c0_g2_i1.p1  ORF type:complete len:297 (-),score=53.98 TRINITY_DN11219_c0_g2_i1:136-1026(-)
MTDPSPEEVDKFLDGNDVDSNAASDLRNCPVEVQRIVLSRGDLSSARNPSAALIARIRDARSSVSAGTHLPKEGGDKSDKAHDQQVEEFIKTNNVDDSAAASLRGSPVEVQRIVIARGELTGARNPSSALLSRIRDAKLPPPNNAMVPHGGAPAPGGYGMPGCPMAGAMPAPPPGGYGYGGCGYGMPAAPGYGQYGQPQFNPYGQAPYGQAAGYYGMYGYPPYGYGMGAYPGACGYGGAPDGSGAYGAQPTQGAKRSRSRSRSRGRDRSASSDASSSSSSSSPSRSKGKKRRRRRR